MSGEKGMKHYPKIIKEEIVKKQKSGESVDSLSKEYEISRYAIQSRCGLRPEKENVLATPRWKGGPGKNGVLTEKEKDVKIKRLKMEVDLLRSFFRITGRR